MCQQKARPVKEFIRSPLVGARFLSTNFIPPSPRHGLAIRFHREHFRILHPIPKFFVSYRCNASKQRKAAICLQQHAIDLLVLQAVCGFISFMHLCTFVFFPSSSTYVHTCMYDRIQSMNNFIYSVLFVTKKETLYRLNKTCLLSLKLDSGVFEMLHKILTSSYFESIRALRSFDELTVKLPIPSSDQPSTFSSP